jgi:uncharacterized membrane protein YvlD (DUF360 family)
MVNLFKGLLLLIVGGGLIILCGLAFAAWWGLCFGSVILGIAIILLAPHLLMLPLPIGLLGVALFSLGITCITNENADKTLTLANEELYRRKNIKAVVLDILPESTESSSNVVHHDESKRNEFFQAVALGDIVKIEELLDSGVSPNLKDVLGNTLLSIAQTRSPRKVKQEVISLLRKRGAT